MPVKSAAVSEAQLVDAILAGDEYAFIGLVERYQASMLRLSRSLVPSETVAEEVVQEAWLGVLNGLERFEGRSSLKTWILRIVANIAMRKAKGESRMVPLSALEPAIGPTVREDLFRNGHDRWPGHWTVAPRDWSSVPEEQLLSRETMSQIATAIEMLPANHRAVITLRDVEGLSSEEVCEFLSISQANQRVMLHRARSRVRSALEQYIEAQ